MLKGTLETLKGHAKKCGAPFPNYRWLGPDSRVQGTEVALQCLHCGDVQKLVDDAIGFMGDVVVGPVA